MSSTVRKNLSLFLSVLIALTLAFIWFNSLLPKSESSDISRGLLDAIYKALKNVGILITSNDDHWIRKLAHFSEFGLLGSELCLLLFVKGRAHMQGFINCCFAGLSAAVTDESLQLISNRGPQVQDVLLDFWGFITGLLLCALLCNAVRARRKKKQSE